MIRSKHSSVFYLLTGAVAIIYLFTGIRKLIGFGSVASDFETWGYHPVFMYIIGITEVVGAIALLIPKTRIPAITGLSVIMLGAIGTHIYSEQYYQMLLPLALLLLLISLLLMSRQEIDDANLREHDQANY